MTHFKRPKSSTGFDQCGEALGKGPTASGGSGMHQEGSLIGAICAGSAFYIGWGHFDRECDKVSLCKNSKHKKRFTLLKIYFPFFQNNSNNDDNFPARA